MYSAFIKEQKLNTLIVSNFSSEKLVLGKTIIVNNNCSYTHLCNKDCLIKGGFHTDLPGSLLLCYC